MPKLIKSIVEGTQPGTKPIFIWDSQIPGFAVKILPSGTRRYFVKYRTKGGGRSAQQRWETIGTHGAITVDQARDEAKRILADVAENKDPQGMKVAFRQAPKMTALWERFERDHLSKRKASTARNYEQLWRIYVKPRLGTKKVIDVNRDDVYRLHRSIKARYQANRTVALLSKMFNLAERWEMRPDNSNPCRHVEKHRETYRERFLTTEEIGRLGQALRDGHAAQTETPHMIAAIQLLLLTGARVSEILGAKWQWIDWEHHIIRLPESKTGAKIIYLGDAAIEVLEHLRSLPHAKENPYVIAGGVKGQPLADLRHPWMRIRERADLDGVRLHDLRHTAASIGVSQGMNLPVIGRLLGHTQASTTQRYAHVGADPALAAANTIGDVVAKAMVSSAEAESKE